MLAWQFIRWLLGRVNGSGVKKVANVHLLFYSRIFGVLNCQRQINLYNSIVTLFHLILYCYSCLSHIMSSRVLVFHLIVNEAEMLNVMLIMICDSFF